MVECGGLVGWVLWTHCFHEVQTVCVLGFKRETRKSQTKIPKSTEENSAYGSRKNIRLRIIIPCMLGSGGEHWSCKLPHAFSHSLILISFLGQFPGKRAMLFHF